MHFGENQLSPGLISLSLLSTAHPMSFYRQPVRASIRYYPDFTLAMDRSPGFGSTPCYFVALFGLAFATATPQSGLTSQQRVTRRPIKQKVRRQACSGALRHSRTRPSDCL